MTPLPVAIWLRNLTSKITLNNSVKFSYGLVAIATGKALGNFVEDEVVFLRKQLSYISSMH